MTNHLRSTHSTSSIDVGPMSDGHQLATPEPIIASKALTPRCHWLVAQKPERRLLNALPVNGAPEG